MQPEKLLVPIDLARCPLEVFEWVNRLSQRSPITVILLHVVPLNVMGIENRIYEELGRRAQSCLKRLADLHLRPSISTLPRVRFGKPAQEILVQARADHADLILLPVQYLDFQKRSMLPWRQSVACHYHLAASDTGAGTAASPQSGPPATQWERARPDPFGDTDDIRPCRCRSRAILSGLARKVIRNAACDVLVVAFL